MTLFKNKYRIESARLKGWDYRNPGYYFVTICTRGRGHYFGKVEGEDVRLSAIGEIAAQCWAETPQHHAGIELDEWVIMPNHAHGIVVIVETLQCNVSTDTVAKNQMSAISPKTGSLSVAVRSFKSAVSKMAHNAGHEFGWQERFWDHIIRDETELNRIRNYIRANPSNWENDRNNDDGLWM
jgi:REP element-mobilizing transposase RayT